MWNVKLVAGCWVLRCCLACFLLLRWPFWCRRAMVVAIVDPEKGTRSRIVAGRPAVFARRALWPFLVALGWLEDGKVDWLVMIP